jgi:hypothetical protein
VFENSVLRIIFVPKKNKITGEWRKFHSQKLYNLYSSPNIRQIKSRRMSWAEHIARMREKSVQCFGEKPRRKETARKTKTYRGGWDQNGSWEDLLEGCGVDSVGSG